MKRVLGLGLAVVAVVAVSSVMAGGDTLKSGLEVGKSPQAFHPLNCTGAKAGEKHCLV